MQNKSMLSYFTGSFVVTLTCMLIAGWMGYSAGGLPGMAACMFTTALLAGLEISVSIDNAVVNATVLKHMSPFWQKMFITIGMLIAVFGMRVAFPILIVAVASSTGFVESFRIATQEPTLYQSIMNDAHVAVMGFGGAFLLTVFLDFFMNKEKEVNWLPGIERVLSNASDVKFLQTLIFVTVIAITSMFVDDAHRLAFLQAAGAGWLVHVVIEMFKHIIGGGNISAVAAKNGFIGFLYLEVLDASFSFDGVVAAFALTNQFWIIALGLCIGAMFVRSMTIYLVEKGTLSEYEYLEPAAFWAIGFLVLSMMLSAAHVSLGELIVGAGSMVIIGTGLYASIRKNKRDALVS